MKIVLALPSEWPSKSRHHLTMLAIAHGAVLFGVQELDEMNAARQAEFQKAEERKQAKEAKKRKEGNGHKSAILKQLMQKRQRLKPS